MLCCQIVAAQLIALCFAHRSLTIAASNTTSTSSSSCTDRVSCRALLSTTSLVCSLCTSSSDGVASLRFPA
uniref:Putative secreted protein n=1 Tax=Anopheles darlingi TaxID=43151 RepID=A0A2M4DM37_ANODA